LSQVVINEVETGFKKTVFKMYIDKTQGTRDTKQNNLIKAKITDH